MALNMKPESQLIFFQHVFGVVHEITSLAENLISAGVVFEVPLFSIKATYQGKVYQLPLAKGTTTLIKVGPYITDPVLAGLKNSIAAWMHNLEVMVKQADFTVTGEVKPNPPKESTPVWDVYIKSIQPGKKIPVIKVIRFFTKMDLKEANDLTNKIDKTPAGTSVLVFTFVVKSTAVDFVKNLQEAGADSHLMMMGKTVVLQDAILPTVNAPSAPEVSKPVSQVIALKDAQALGQKVHGTSQGSVYYCIAFNDHVKIAARLYKSQGTISIRAEWNGASQEEIQKLKSANMSMKTNYASMHVTLGEVAIEQAIGAWLFKSGIKYKQMVTHVSNLVMEN